MGTTGQNRLLSSFLILLLVIHLGAFGYSVLLPETSFRECLYRTILIVTTVNEPWPELETTPALERYTIVLLIVGMGVVLYTVSALAAFILEADLRKGVHRRRAKKRLGRMKNHIIVCGGGETGEIILKELSLLGEPYVVIEKRDDRVQELRKDERVVVIRGDATQDKFLQQAGIESARGVISSLPTDKENLFVVITARQLNPKVKLVARSVDPSTDEKLYRAGADHVVAANTIGADRMVSAMVRPHVVTFMDRLLRDPDSTNRIEEVLIRAGCELDGKSIAQSQIGKRTNLLVLALQLPGGPLVCNPPASERLEAGTLLVVLGDVASFPTLRRMAGAASAGEAGEAGEASATATARESGEAGSAS